MYKYLLLKIVILLISSNFCCAQDAQAKSDFILNPEMTQLKSAFANFFAQKSDNDGGTFLKHTITALENGVLTDGMELNALREVFSGEVIIPEITVDSKIVRNVGMVPLEGSFFWHKDKKLPGVPGPIWFLIFDINKKNQIHHISLRHMTIKDLYMNWYD